MQNAYARGVTINGNPRARALIENVFELTDEKWRGIGTIARSGLRLRRAFAAFDAAPRFERVEHLRTSPVERRDASRPHAVEEAR